MKKFFKIVGLVVLGLVAAFVALLLVLRSLYPPEKIQSIVLAELQSRLHREVRVKHAAIGIMGLNVDGLEISQAPDFKAGTFAKADTIRVEPRLWPLLQRRLEVSDVLLRGWECRIERRRDGSWNFENAAAPTKAPTNQAPASPTPSAAAGAPAAPAAEPPWEIGRVRIENGTLHYVDESAPSPIVVRDIRFSAWHLQPQGPFPIELSADYAAKDLSGAVQAKASVNLAAMTPAGMSATLGSFSVRHQGLIVEGSGSVKDLTAPSVHFELSVPRQRLNPADAARWPAQLPLLIPIQARGEIVKRGNRVDVRDTKILWNSLRMEIAGDILLKDSGSPDVHLRLQTGQFSLADMAGLLPVAQRVGPRGTGEIDVKADGPADSPALAGHASLKGVSVTYQGQELSGLDATAKFDPQSVTSSAKGKWNRGIFDLQAELRNYRKSPDLRLKGKLTELDLAALFQLLPSETEPSSAKGAPASPAPASKATTPPPAPKAPQAPGYSIHTAGNLTIDKIVHPNFTSQNNTFQWDLKDANVLPRITGTARIAIGPGRYDDLKSVSKNGVIKAVFLPLTVLQSVGHLAGFSVFPNLDRGSFKSITGDYLFQHGLMTIKESHMDSSQAYMTATGKANFADETLDMTLTTRINKHLPGISGPIGIKCKGTFADIESACKPDYGTILKQPAIQQGVDKILKGLFR